MSKPREPGTMTAAIDPNREPDWDELEAFTASLPDTDGVPLETPWHYAQIGLLIAMLYCRFRGRTDFYAGGNMFIYYSREQAMNRDYRGPDFFFVNDVDGTRPRRFWAVWQEGGRFPDVIVELLSPTTAQEDRTTKRRIYERIFGTNEYILYDPDTRQLEGHRLGARRRYQAIAPDERGWLWSEELQLWIGFWEGTYLNVTGRWLRFYDAEGRLVPIDAEVEKQCADAAEAEIARLKEQLAQRGGAAPESSG